MQQRTAENEVFGPCYSLPKYLRNQEPKMHTLDDIHHSYP